MAIFWTTVVGEGLINEKSKDLDQAFGKVHASLFSLFRMMNGDTDFAEDVFNVGWGRVAYVAFMVTVGWAILAILTSVVSDNMIEASQKTQEEDEHVAQLEADADMNKRLNRVFQHYDTKKE